MSAAAAAATARPVRAASTALPALPTQTHASVNSSPVLLRYTARITPLPPPVVAANPPHATPVATTPRFFIALSTPCGSAQSEKEKRRVGESGGRDPLTGKRCKN